MRESEDYIINKIDNLDLGPILRCEEKIGRPDPEDFKNIYSNEEIERDLKHLKSIERKIEETRSEESRESERRGKSLEIVIADQIYDGEWMGSEALVTLTSRYDDVVNGVDLIVEFEEEKVAFAVDASMNTDPSEIKKKIERNIDKVLKKKSSVKYFQSQKDDYKGKIDGLIPVVVGLDRINADSLFRTFAELKKLEEEKKDEMKNRRRWLRTKLCEDPLQDIFLQQIKIQIEMYISLLEDQDTKDQCERVLLLVNDIIEKKEDSLYMIDDVPLDEVFDTIEKISREY